MNFLNESYYFSTNHQICSNFFFLLFLCLLVGSLALRTGHQRTVIWSIIWHWVCGCASWDVFCVFFMDLKSEKSDSQIGWANKETLIADVHLCTFLCPQGTNSWCRLTGFEVEVVLQRSCSAMNVTSTHRKDFKRMTHVARVDQSLKLLPSSV